MKKLYRVVIEIEADAICYADDEADAELIANENLENILDTYYMRDMARTDATLIRKANELDKDERTSLPYSDCDEERTCEEILGDDYLEELKQESLAEHTLYLPGVK